MVHSGRSVLSLFRLMAKRDPYPNRIREVMRWEATEEITPFNIDDGLHAAISWDLPHQYACIVRHQDPVTEKITEKSYRNAKAAHKYLMKLWLSDAQDVVVLTDQAIHSPSTLLDDIQ